METRAPYITIGAFVLAVIVAVFGFVYWLNTGGGIERRSTYRIAFEGPVPGLLTGAAVLFNGIRVGEVTALGLDAGKPRGVAATIAVAERTPVRKDTRVGLDFQGLTGVPVVTLEGGDGTEPLEAGGLLVADKSAGQGMMQAARAALSRADAVLADNAEPLRETLASFRTFADALARNTPRLEGIVGGLERMTGGGAAAVRKVSYDLPAAKTFPEPRMALKAGLAIAEPTAIVRLQTQRILLAAGAEGPEFEDAQWADSLPLLIQARLLQSFENYDIAHPPLRADNGADAETRLVLDLRRFEIEPGPPSRAAISLSAKLVDQAGHVAAARVFDVSRDVASLTSRDAAAAFAAAFGDLARDVVTWTAAQP